MAIETADAAVIAINGGLQSRQFQGLFSIIPFTFTFDENSIASGAASAGDIVVTGARLGDFVLVAANFDLIDIHISAFVRASNSVTVLAQELGLGTNTTLNANATYNGLVLSPKQNVIAWTAP